MEGVRRWIILNGLGGDDVEGEFESLIRVVCMTDRPSTLGFELGGLREECSEMMIV